jgi:hypothetical protein
LDFLSVRAGSGVRVRDKQQLRVRPP